MEREYFEKEFNLENNRCNQYFDLMYRTLQFSFASTAALLAFGFGVDIKPNYQFIVLCILVPAVIYVFGTLYAYNAYSLAISGKRAEQLHKYLYEKDIDDEKKEILSKYIIGNRSVSLLSYGVALIYFIGCPIGSIIVGYFWCEVSLKNNIINYLPIFFLLCYIVIMSIIIVNIGKNFKV